MYNSVNMMESNVNEMMDVCFVSESEIIFVNENISSGERRSRRR